MKHEHDDQGRDLEIGGGLGKGDGDTWVAVYARVPDVDASLAKAEELGAKRIYGPKEFDPDLLTGAFRDPAGNVFGVYARR